MKITKNIVRRIIKEELRNLTLEGDEDEEDEDEDKPLVPPEKVKRKKKKPTEYYQRRWGRSQLEPHSSEEGSYEEYADQPALQMSDPSYVHELYKRFTGLLNWAETMGYDENKWKSHSEDE